MRLIVQQAKRNDAQGFKSQASFFGETEDSERAAGGTWGVPPQAMR
jgi:hypothetical protein